MGEGKFDGNRFHLSLREFKDKMDDLLNSEYGLELINRQRYSDLEEEVVRLRKETVEDGVVFTHLGYVDTLVNRKMLFKIYGTLVNVLQAINAQRDIELELYRSFIDFKGLYEEFNEFVEGFENSKERAVEYEQFKNFIANIKEEVPHPESGYFRLSGFQRVYELSNFNKDGVEIDVLRDYLNEHFGFELRSLGRYIHELRHIDKPEFKIILYKYRFVVMLSDKNAFTSPFDKNNLPDDPDRYRSFLEEALEEIAHEFTTALSNYIGENIEFVDMGWAGENPTRNTRDKENKKVCKPELIYVHPQLSRNRFRFRFS